MAGILDAPGLTRQQIRDTLFKGLPVIASRCMGFGSNGTNLSNGTDTSTTYRTMHVVMVSSTDFRLVYGNFYNGATSGPNSITVNASMDAVQIAPTAAGSGGSAYQVSFGGLATVTIAPGRYVVSDPIPRNAVRGNYLYVRTNVGVASAGQKWPLDMNTSATNSEGAGASNTDCTGSGASCSTTQGPAYGPLAILGTPAFGTGWPRTWGAVGDSILYGAGDNRAGVGSTGGANGFFVQACVAANFGYQNVGHPGEQGSSFAVGNGFFTRLPQIAACTHVLDEYGHNDIYIGSQTVAAIQATKISIWFMLAARGIKVKTMTLTPCTTSTDCWATLGNQTITSGNATRVSLNDWIRDGAPMLNGVAVATGSNAAGTVRFGGSGHPAVGYFETADTVESARDSGLWAITGVRTVADGAINSSSTTFTSATANFTQADKYRQIAIAGAGAAGAELVTSIAGVTNATTVTLSGAGASTTVSGTATGIGMLCIDGTHNSSDGHNLMAAPLNLTA